MPIAASPASSLPAPPFPASPWPRRIQGLPLLMGILNVTPDSFSDGGRFIGREAAITQGAAMVEAGADMLDIGGESTRPGFTPVDAEEEAARILPVIRALKAAHPAMPLSVDTYKAKTARAALQAGASIVNDIWGLHQDVAMAEVVAAHEAGLCIMHNRAKIDESLDILADIERFFERALRLAEQAGIPQARIALDPGIGFGKSFEQNCLALRHLARFRAFGCAILLGVSRKSMLGLLTERKVEDRLAATISANLIGMLAGADILRVHDIAEHKDAIRVAAALRL